MHHTSKQTYISLQSGSLAEAYAISSAALKEIRALLKREHAKKAEYIPFLSVEVVFPELQDNIMRPANYLRGIRLREGLTQAELAKKTSMKQHHISEMENGKRSISKEAAKKLASALNTDWRRML
jgi:DNA-binding XRE family transcriptional regulator